MTDPVWWVYLFWLPDFLNTKYGLDITKIGLPLVVIYIIADVGRSAAGGFPRALIKSGWSINASRKMAMLICAVAVVPIVLASLLPIIYGSRLS